MQTIEEIKEKLIAEEKLAAKKLLNVTDWYFIRRDETGQAVPQEVLDARAAIRSSYDSYVALLSAATTFKELSAASYEIFQTKKNSKNN